MSSLMKIPRLTKDQMEAKINFIHRYIKAPNASNGSLFDPNSNVTSKNIATLNAELNKDYMIQIKRKLVYDKINSIFGQNTANKYISQLEEHLTYANDESVVLPYCSAVTLYPFIEKGLQSLGGESKAPKHLSSYNGGFINLVFALSSMFAGAIATVEYLLYFDYFARKDYGNNYLEDNTKIIEQELQQVVYALNQPASARNYQSVFWNISIFDSNYFNALFGNTVFPDGSKPEWKSINKLQRFFMKFFNKERHKALLTFPVVTATLLYDKDKNIIDKEYEDFLSEELSLGNSFFIYTSDTVDSLSSCCFSGDTKVLWKSSTLGVQCTSLKELYELKWNTAKKNLRIFHNGSWVKGKPIKVESREMFKVTTSNNKTYIITDNHINITYDGEKTTDKLTTNDYLAFNTKALQAVFENDESLTYEQGFAVGAFLGDGSFGSRTPTGIYEVNYSLNSSKYETAAPILEKAVESLNSINTINLGKIQNNVYPIRISSKPLVAFIQKWTNWKEGTKASTKELNLNCLLQSYEFRKGILDGWYITDGGNSNRCYTTSSKLKDCMEILITSLGINSIINKSDRTDETVIIRDETYKRNYPLWCVRWYDSSKRTMEEIFKWKNNTQYFKIISIERLEEDDAYCIEVDNKDEPYFTLPSGLITHNCRLRNDISDQINDFSYSLGAGGIMTGSVNVLTLNMNRFVQKCISQEQVKQNKIEDNIAIIEDKLKTQIEYMHKWQYATKQLFMDMEKHGLLPAYTANFINFNKQYVTIGLNGLLESGEYLKAKPCTTDKYKRYIQSIFKTISSLNKKNSEKYKMKINTEMIPSLI